MASVNGFRYARTASCVNEQLGSVPSSDGEASFRREF
jgi:hypothetical protein